MTNIIKIFLLTTIFLLNGCDNSDKSADAKEEAPVTTEAVEVKEEAAEAVAPATDEAVDEAAPVAVEGETEVVTDEAAPKAVDAEPAATDDTAVETTEATDSDEAAEPEAKKDDNGK